jgi:hypothetical protein
LSGHENQEINIGWTCSELTEDIIISVGEGSLRNQILERERGLMDDKRTDRRER